MTAPVLYKSTPVGPAAWLDQQLGGGHVIYEIPIALPDLDRLFPDRLAAFGRTAPTPTSWMKQHVLYRPALVGAVRRLLTGRKSPHRELHSDSFRQMFHPGRRYNYVICADRIVAGCLHDTGTFADRMLAKHVLVAGFHPDVRYAGELWVEPDGSVHYNNNSGTYCPDGALIENVRLALRTLFPEPDLHFAAHAVVAD